MLELTNPSTEQYFLVPMKTPEELLALTEADSKACNTIIDFINNCSDFNDYDGGAVVVIIPQEIWEENMKVRPNVRRNELFRKFLIAGWKDAKIHSNPKGDVKITMSNQRA